MISLALTFSACSVNNGPSGASEDASISGLAAEAVGGALNFSLSSGTFTMSEMRSQQSLFSWLNLFSGIAHASTSTCPTISDSSSSGPNTCSSASNVATLDYSDCSFGNSSATWNGFTQLSFSGATALACGTFPSPTNDTLLRQAVASAGGAAGTLTRTSSSGTVLTVDDTIHGIDGNYQGDTFNGRAPSNFSFTPFNSGGGKEVVFNASGQQTSVTIAEHLSGSLDGNALFDHTIAGTVNVSESGSGSSTVWTATAGTVSSGTCSNGVTGYDNVMKMLGQTCFENVTYNATCCQPISGTIVTTFTNTSNSPSTAIACMSGQTETLTITGCGKATYTSCTGATTSVNLDQCF